ncbi:glycosyl transferase family 2 [Sphingomonas aerolata]|uniref:Glycosyl transferase family 2 n=1 Tax=Sphingomonas aerolata TaxID=185951 RepID=A0A2T4YMB5_9SPHN|nr:glycosyltransferase [Sphingomonas aerolata]PTM44549.1 glycosyl transferase family 2 [Sphingomonas aerolata]
MTDARFCVCVPARDEADRLPILLDALARQDVDGPIRVSILINNTVDDSVAAVARAQAAWGERLHLAVACYDLPPERAHAGTARRLAMEAGLARIDPDRGVLISTDADTRPPSDWISAMLRAIDAGLDIVGGRIVVDDAEPLAADMDAMQIKLDRYWACVRAIEDDIDPCRWDPAPRHGDHTGASLAILAPLYRAAGGVPAIPAGEDRALVEAAVAAGGRLGHPMSVWTRVSARTIGRATGGMADHMQVLSDRVARGESTFLPSFDQWRARAAWRRMRRDQPGGDAGVARDEPLLPAMRCDMPLGLDR